MAELQKQQEAQEQLQQAASLEKSIDVLAKYGGFDLLEGTIEGVQNMNPERKARRNIFLTENTKKAEREKLKKTLELWEKVLTEAQDLPDMVTYCTEHSEQAEKVLTGNLADAIESTRELEQSYRNVALFF